MGEKETDCESHCRLREWETRRRVRVGEEFHTGQLGLGVIYGVAAAACVENSDRKQKRRVLRGFIGYENAVLTSNSLIFSKRLNSIGIV